MDSRGSGRPSPAGSSRAGSRHVRAGGGESKPASSSRCETIERPATASATSRTRTTPRSSDASVTSSTLSVRAKVPSATGRVNVTGLKRPGSHAVAQVVRLTKNVGSRRRTVDCSACVSGPSGLGSSASIVSVSQALVGGGAVVSTTTREGSRGNRCSSHESATRTLTRSVDEATRLAAATFSSKRDNPAGSVWVSRCRAPGDIAGTAHSWGVNVTRACATTSAGRTGWLNRRTMIAGLSTRPVLRYQSAPSSRTVGVGS